MRRALRYTSCSRLQRLHKQVHTSTGMNASMRVQRRSRAISCPCSSHFFRGARNAHASFLYGVSPIPGQASIVESNDLDAAFDADLIQIILAKAALR